MSGSSSQIRATALALILVTPMLGQWARPAATAWQHVVAGGLAVDMPGIPKETIGRCEYGEAVALPHYYAYDGAAETTLVSYMEFDRPINQAGYLQGVRDYFAGGRPIVEEDIDVGGYHGKRLKGIFKGQATVSIVVVAGQRVYQATFQSLSYLNQLIDGDRFFRSFRIYDGTRACSFSQDPAHGTTAFCGRM